MSLANVSTIQPELRLSVASGDALSVRSFSIHEGLSELFSIRLVARSANNDVDFDAVIAKPASFSLSRPGSSKSWHGIVSEIDLVRVEPDGLATYELCLRPRLWLLGQRRNYRVFQLRSELEIVRQILSEWGIEPELHVEPGRHVARKFRVQYAESDLDFVRRLLEDVGATFSFFDPGDGAATRLRIDDAPEQRAVDHPLLPFLDDAGGAPGAYVTEVHVSQRVRPGAVTIGDVDYRRPSAQQPRLSAQHGLAEEQSLEQYHHAPGAFLFTREGRGATPQADDRGTSRTDETLGRDRTRVRLEAERLGAKQVELRTNLFALSAGHTVTVAGFPHRLVTHDRKLLVLEIRLEGTPETPTTLRAALVPTELPVRPRFVTRRPAVQGLESATVVGPAGETLHTDEFGRVKIQFHWDREGARDHRSSCWVPVSQALGGAGFGAVSLPRIGQEVLVEFLGGDPDRPVVVGRVYTQTQPVPYALPQNATITGLRSASFVPEGGDDTPAPSPSPLGPRSTAAAKAIADLVKEAGFGACSPGGGSTHSWKGSELTFEDRAGKELVYLQAERDMNTLVKNACVTNVGAQRVTDVGADDVLNVHDRQAITVDGDRSILVHGGQSHHVVGAIFESTDSFQFISTKDSYTSEAKSHELKSEVSIQLTVGASTILITPHNIILQSPGVHINPGPELLAQALANPEVPLPTPAEIAAAKAAAEEAAAAQEQQEASTAELEKDSLGPEVTGHVPQTDQTRERLARDLRDPLQREVLRDGIRTAARNNPNILDHDLEAAVEAGMKHLDRFAGIE